MKIGLLFEPVFLTVTVKNDPSDPLKSFCANSTSIPACVKKSVTVTLSLPKQVMVRTQLSRFIRYTQLHEVKVEASCTNNHGKSTTLNSVVLTNKLQAAL